MSRCFNTRTRSKSLMWRRVFKIVRLLRVPFQYKNNKAYSLVKLDKRQTEVKDPFFLVKPKDHLKMVTGAPQFLEVMAEMF